MPVFLQAYQCQYFFLLTDHALGLMNDDNVKGNKVILEAKDDPIRIGQEWLIGKQNDEGWFTLKNPISGRYLMAENSSKTTISGM